MKWYHNQPILGLECSACKTQLAKAYPRAKEEFPFNTLRDTIGLEHPFRMVGVGHSIYILFTYGLVDMPFDTKIEWYVHYQWLIHILYAYLFSICLKNVQNRGMYVLEWCKPSRIGVILLHAWCLYTLRTTFLLGGIASDLILYVYFYEHYSILLAMNRQNEFMFVNYHQE